MLNVHYIEFKKILRNDVPSLNCYDGVWEGLDWVD